MANVVPLTRRRDPLAYDPGVVPFDRTNPHHVRAWNSLWALGRTEAAYASTSQVQR